jgi:inward rectifier potassium channel
VISSLDGVPCLMFRIANTRASQIVEAEVGLTLVRTETTSEGGRFREMRNLRLERDQSPLFALSWTIVHPIDEKSPLYGQTWESLRRTDSELLVTLSGIDEVLANKIHARYSYIPDEVLWGRRFADVMARNGENQIVLDLTKFHETVPG